MTRPLSRSTLGTAFFVLALPGILLAQEDDPLAVEAEVGASLFFGNTNQTTVTTRTSTGWTGDLWSFQGAARFSYGETENDLGETFVSKRSWTVNTEADYTGFGRVSPSVTGRVESSFEKRIDSRVSVGGGASLEAVSTEQTELAFGLSILVEHTEPRADPSLEVQSEAETVGRWSTGVRFRRTLSDGRVTFTSETGYRPELGELDSFTLVSENGLAFQLSEVLSLKLSFVDSYDSEAEARGAETNNDGQLVFGLLGSF